MMSLTHFTLLFKRQWFENRKAWLVGSAAIAAILAFLFLLAWHWRTSFNGDTLHGIFLLLLFGGGGLFMSAILKDLGNKQKGIWFLILPASAATKLAIALVYGIMVYLTAYFALFYGVKALVVWFLVPSGLSWGYFDLFKNGFYQFLFTFVSFQSIILLGSIYFNKSQFLKTLLLIITGLFIAFNGNSLLLKLMTGESNLDSSIPLDYFQFVHNGENIYVYLPDAAGVAVSVLLWVIVPICLWVITWFRLKEKEL
ncbi:MAG: hypothetical protein JWR09_3480 [Mucilaginibacter sp.]|nr:hypothetical protein [Mucilaginibacter sp.]